MVYIKLYFYILSKFKIDPPTVFELSNKSFENESIIVKDQKIKLLSLNHYNNYIMK